jgi:predicted ATPase
MKKSYVITGGPGFGKTSVLQELRARGYNAGEELSRQFIKEQMEGLGALLPWVDRLGYSEEMLKKRIAQFQATPERELWFFDRGVPDLIAYIVKDGLPVPDIFYEAAKKYRYHDLVFLTPPWEHIHTNDRERRESFPEAVVIHQEIERIYAEVGYACVALPKTTISERASFILDAIQTNTK